MDTNTIHTISQNVLEATAQDMTGKYVWLFLAGLVILIFKSSIEKLAASFFIFAGSDYKTDDVVYVDGKPGRIVRLGLTKTVFFIYDVVDGKVVGLGVGVGLGRSTPCAKVIGRSNSLSA